MLSVRYFIDFYSQDSGVHHNTGYCRGTVIFMYHTLAKILSVSMYVIYSKESKRGYLSCIDILCRNASLHIHTETHGRSAQTSFPLSSSPPSPPSPPSSSPSFSSPYFSSYFFF